MPDWFSIVRRVLPGSYTFILPASKQMPKVVVNSSKHRQKQRQTVGVRMPAHPVTLALLSTLSRCLPTRNLAPRPSSGGDPSSPVLCAVFRSLDAAPASSRAARECLLRLTRPRGTFSRPSQAEAVRVGTCCHMRAPRRHEGLHTMRFTCSKVLIESLSCRHQRDGLCMWPPLGACALLSLCMHMDTLAAATLSPMT